jgi:hypothetical protein
MVITVVGTNNQVCLHDFNDNKLNQWHLRMFYEGIGIFNWWNFREIVIKFDENILKCHWFNLLSLKSCKQT